MNIFTDTPQLLKELDESSERLQKSVIKLQAARKELEQRDKEQDELIERIKNSKLIITTNGNTNSTQQP